MKCPVCENAYEPGDRFCRNCGTSLVEEQPGRRFRPLFQKTQDPSRLWDHYIRPFLGAALLFCLALLALAGIVFGIQYILRSN